MDCSVSEGQFSTRVSCGLPNEYGGNENLEAISFLKEFNEVVYGEFPDAMTIAEESTAFAGVSRPTYAGGLGFGQKWMMGWMHDTLKYFKRDSIYRRYHQNDITFSIIYAFTENFMLPLSHDEVVHGKGSLLGRMPGDEWNKFANLRTMFGYMFTHPGTKLLFMGGEFGQSGEWNHDRSLDWHLLDHAYHRGVQQAVKDLNALYKAEPALYKYPFSGQGFEWVDYSDRDNSVLVFLRKADDPKDALVVVCNFTPQGHHHYRLGVDFRGTWKEVFNSDNLKYGGSGVLNQGLLYTTPVKYHNRNYSITIEMPPLAVSVFKLEEELAEFDIE
ncbi:MAG TPA: hypothetical protein DCE81_14590 [Cytophagales bacterium]|nr:hypothetical protein [Cytophagales bacterium]